MQLTDLKWGRVRVRRGGGERKRGMRGDAEGDRE
jgi:hypothetical protein